jgi:hypothetical protein
MYEDKAPVNYGLYSITSNQNTRYVYGTDKGIASFSSQNPSAIVKSVEYSEGEAAGNYWDSIDYPRDK